MTNETVNIYPTVSNAVALERLYDFCKRNLLDIRYDTLLRNKKTCEVIELAIAFDSNGSTDELVLNMLSITERLTDLTLSFSNKLSVVCVTTKMRLKMNLLNASDLVPTLNKYIEQCVLKGVPSINHLYVLIALYSALMDSTDIPALTTDNVQYKNNDVVTSLLNNFKRAYFQR